ncbi:uncharacterized protein [Antedon mediterranea]|uniref:uncharacterized protein n=1 Tax=Antedon mediterranea TaxID=105859 RepID=UPI003AF5E174
MAAPIKFAWNTFNHEYPSNSGLTIWKKICYDSHFKDTLVKMLNEGCMFLEPAFNVYLLAESCTLRRLLYKLQNQQRHWKWFSLLGKIQKCLEKALKMNLSNLFKTILSLCETGKHIKDMEQVPSATCTKFLLEKLVGLSKLCSHILQLSEQTFVLIVGNLRIGQFVAQNIFFVALISRIWVLVKGVLVKLFLWYEVLRNFGLSDEQSEYYTIFKELPHCLSKWVELDASSLKSRSKHISEKTKKDTLSKMFGSLQKPPENLDVVQQNLSKDDDLYMAMEACSEMDIGEPVTKEDDDIIIHKKKKQKKKRLLCEDEAATSNAENQREHNDDKTGVTSTEDVGVAIPRKKKKKKYRTKIDEDDTTDDLSTKVQIMKKANEQSINDDEEVLRKEKRKKTKKVRDKVNTSSVEVEIEENEECDDNNAKKMMDKTDIMKEVDMPLVDNQSNEEGKKKRKRHEHDENIYEQAVVQEEVKGDNTKQIKGQRKIKKKKKKETIYLESNEYCDTVDTLQESDNADKEVKKKKRKKVEEEEIIIVENKSTKRKHKKANEKIDKTSGIMPKKLPSNEIHDRTDEDELDDIFSCLQ